MGARRASSAKSARKQVRSLFAGPSMASSMALMRSSRVAWEGQGVAGGAEAGVCAKGVGEVHVAAITRRATIHFIRRFYRSTPMRMVRIESIEEQPQILRLTIPRPKN